MHPDPESPKASDQMIASYAAIRPAGESGARGGSDGIGGIVEQYVHKSQRRRRIGQRLDSRLETFLATLPDTWRVELQRGKGANVLFDLALPCLVPNATRGTPVRPYDREDSAQHALFLADPSRG